MSQNPFDNQQSPFGSSQQNNPFGQQGGFGDQGGFNPSGFNQPAQPQKKGGGAGRTCLILVGLMLVCCLACVGVGTYFAFQNKPYVPAFAWIGTAGTGDADQTAGIVCEESQAELFSVTFNNRYPNVTSISATTVELNDDTVHFEGTFTYDEGTFDFEADFVVDTDGEGNLGPFGCVEAITWVVTE